MVVTTSTGKKVLKIQGADSQISIPQFVRENQGFGPLFYQGNSFDYSDETIYVLPRKENWESKEAREKDVNNFLLIILWDEDQGRASSISNYKIE